MCPRHALHNEYDGVLTEPLVRTVRPVTRTRS